LSAIYALNHESSYFLLRKERGKQQEESSQGQQLYATSSKNSALKSQVNNANKVNHGDKKSHRPRKKGQTFFLKSRKIFFFSIEEVEKKLVLHILSQRQNSSLNFKFNFNYSKSTVTLGLSLWIKVTLRDRSRLRYLYFWTLQVSNYGHYVYNPYHPQSSSSNYKRNEQQSQDRLLGRLSRDSPETLPSGAAKCLLDQNLLPRAGRCKVPILQG